MKSMCFLCLFLTLNLINGTVFCQQNENSPQKGLTVTEYAFCENVENRQPVGENKAFSSDVGRVFFWTSIHGTELPTMIKHVWYYKNEKKSEILLNIKYKRTRTWSYKTILPEWVGDWHVEVVDEDGNVLGKYSFKIHE